ncbi:unnamed protein product [Parajaminaea phylloscopi]
MHSLAAMAIHVPATSRLWLAALLAAAVLLASPATSFPVDVTAASSSAPPARDYPILRRRPASRTGDDLLSWANNHKSHLQGKYGLAEASTQQKRAVGAATMVNYQYDSTWFAAFQVGTPAQDLNLVLDTGSSDIWLAATNYTASASSTFSNTSSSFSITYGSGDVQGYMAKETFSIAGHTIANQPFAVGTQISSNLQDAQTAGICGLGFQDLSMAKSQPLWAAAGENEFAFYLQRATATTTTISTGGGGGGGGTGGPGGYGKRDSASDTTYGGVFTLGGTNSSLYQGEINWSNVISKTYWLITLGGVTVNQTAVDIGSTNKAAIDTGTTLIGGPDSIVADLYSRIEGASAIAGADGYYQFPCSSKVTTTMTFGDQQYTISPQQFNVAQVDASGTYCMGAFFSVGSSSSSNLQWIVGDSFLSSVYSVFSNGDTARVGFAALATGLNDGGASSTTVAKTQQASSATAIPGRAAVPVVVAAMTASYLVANALL